MLVLVLKLVLMLLLLKQTLLLILLLMLCGSQYLKHRKTLDLHLRLGVETPAPATAPAT